MVLDKVLNLFRSKRRLRAHFIDEAGLIFTRVLPYDNNTFTTKFAGHEHSYIVDHNYIVYSSKDRMPTSLYYVNNPHPVRLQHERNLETDSVGFKNILDSKTIQDLFSPEAKNVLMILMIMVGVAIVLVLEVLAQTAGWINIGGGGA